MNYKIKKLSGIVALSSAMIFMPQTNTEANSTYTLNNNVNKYINAYDAKANRNSLGEYASGKYYIYKQYNGMINISKEVNEPGAWIDPTDNKSNNIKRETSTSIKSDQYVLESSTTGYINSNDAKYKRNARTTLSKGTYYVYKEYNGMINISRNKNEPGSWINPNSTKLVQKESNSTNNENKSVKTTNNQFVLKEEKNGYVNADDAKRGANPRRRLSKGTYYVYKRYNGMLNLSKTKNSPGSWVNIDEKSSNISKNNTSSSSPMKYSLNHLQYHGVIRWSGKKFTYYSQRVLPGNGLNIPGRHVNEAGYVADKDGYIVLANSAPKGTIIDTPFGYKGKVYDRGTYGNHFDVYTK